MNKTESKILLGKKRRAPFLFQVILISGFLALIWFSFGQNVLAPQRQAAPPRLGTLELVSSIEGAEALAQIGKLHGTDINLVSAYIAEYAHKSPYHPGTERVTLWVSRAESSDTAAELTRRMAEGIARGNSGFTNLRRLTIAGREVFQVDGAGGEHFFYHSREARERVVWITIKSGEAMPILEVVVSTF